MAVTWTVWPLDSDMKAWLEKEGIAFPASASQWPTGSEIKRALSDLGLEIAVRENGRMGPWSALVQEPDNPEREWAVLEIQEYSGDDEPQKLYFSKGDETLIRRILSRISSSSGPLVLLDDAGSPPEIVAEGV